MALAASMMLFASVIAHEMSHSLVALRYGIPVRSITLFMFGGAAHISREAPRPGMELLIALAGPVCSVLLALLFLGAGFLVERYSVHVAVMMSWLFLMNMALGIFNLIPGFPLDGGRVLRAAIWAVSGNYAAATRVATMGGYATALLLMALGAYVFMVSRSALQGAWLALVGWFLFQAAFMSYRQHRQRRRLEGLTARELIPGFPLDGGRVLRAAIWAVSGNYATATRVATMGGYASSICRAALDGAGRVCVHGESQRAAGRVACPGGVVPVPGRVHELPPAPSAAAAIEGLTARELMSTALPEVSPDASIRELIESGALRDRRGLVVVEDERTVGLVAAASVGKMSRRARAAAQVLRHGDQLSQAERVMSPVDRATARWRRTTTASECWRTYHPCWRTRETGEVVLAVVESGELVGVITPESVMRR